jgi:hypothetical protein
MLACFGQTRSSEPHTRRLHTTHTAFLHDVTRSYTMLQLGHKESEDWTPCAHPEPYCHVASPTPCAASPVWVEMRRARSTSADATLTSRYLFCWHIPATQPSTSNLLRSCPINERSVVSTSKLAPLRSIPSNLDSYLVRSKHVRTHVYGIIHARTL